MLVKQFGETIRKRRKELNITQPHLAELAEISTNTLYKLERGQGNPSGLQQASTGYGSLSCR